MTFMAKDSLSDRIDALFRQCEWEDARGLLEAEREDDPNNHWILTQLGVTFYEQKRYQEALKLLLESRKIVPDCPLTLWNLAGTLDALGKHVEAVRIYTWLLESKKSAREDPCWESKKWAEALKADCVFRLGICFKKLGKKQKADQCFRQYVNLLLSGIDGTYSIEEAMRQVRSLTGSGKNGAAELRKAVNAMR
jgi:tetratricopeptide (TPR) repeat protein